MVARDRWASMANGTRAFITPQSASEEAQGRINQLNSQIKASSSTSPQDRWQPGEWGKFLDRLNEFQSRGRAATWEEEKKVVDRVEKFLRDNYTPKGETVPDEVFVAVSRTVGTTLLTFMMLSYWKSELSQNAIVAMNNDPSGRQWVECTKYHVGGC